MQLIGPRGSDSFSLHFLSFPRIFLLSQRFKMHLQTSWESEKWVTRTDAEKIFIRSCSERKKKQKFLSIIFQSVRPYSRVWFPAFMQHSIPRTKVVRGGIFGLKQNSVSPVSFLPEIIVKHGGGRKRKIRQEKERLPVKKRRRKSRKNVSAQGRTHLLLLLFSGCFFFFCANRQNGFFLLLCLSLERQTSEDDT